MGIRRGPKRCCKRRMPLCIARKRRDVIASRWPLPLILRFWPWLAEAPARGTTPDSRSALLRRRRRGGCFLVRPYFGGSSRLSAPLDAAPCIRALAPGKIKPQRPAFARRRSGENLAVCSDRADSCVQCSARQSPRRLRALLDDRVPPAALEFLARSRGRMVPRTQQAGAGFRGVALRLSVGQRPPASLRAPGNGGKRAAVCRFLRTLLSVRRAGHRRGQ